MRMTPIDLNFVFDADDLTQSQPVCECGNFNYLMIKTPNFTNAVTTKLQILDADGDLVWDMTAALADGAAVVAQVENSVTQYQFQWPIPLHRKWTVKATLSGVAGAGGGTVKAIFAVNAS